MEISSSIQRLLNFAQTCLIFSELGEDSDKSLDFDGRIYTVSGYLGGEYFEQEFTDLLSAISHYEDIILKSEISA